VGIRYPPTICSKVGAPQHKSERSTVYKETPEESSEEEEAKVIAVLLVTIGTLAMLLLIVNGLSNRKLKWFNYIGTVLIAFAIGLFLYNYTYLGHTVRDIVRERDSNGEAKTVKGEFSSYAHDRNFTRPGC
jgi:H+/gluconate symporter-like permease